MKKVLTVCLLILISMGCSKKESEVPGNEPESCQVKYLFFRDDISFTDFGTMSGISGPYICSYNYHQGSVNRITGGYFPVPAGTNLLNYIFSYSTVYDSITAGNNTFQLFEKYIIDDGNTFEKSTNPLIFYLDAQNRLVKVFRKDGLNPDGYDLNYTYANDQITETFKTSYTRRTFFMDKNNLVKVTAEHYDPQGNLYSTKEILFLDYDDHPNPFKNRYYITGAFFRAFSQNNYRAYTINQYGKTSDSTFGLITTSHVDLPLTYHSNGYPNFGE